MKIIFWQLKTAFFDAYSNKFRFFLAVIVIGLSVGMLIGVNGAVDNLSNNYADILFSEQSDTDLTIQKADQTLISNVSTLLNEFSNASLLGLTPRYYVDANILLENSKSGDIAFPTQVVGINFTQETKIKLGSFSPEVSSLGLNESIMFGTFGKQVTSRIGNKLNLKLSFIGQRAVNVSFVTQVVEQQRKFSRGNWNVIVVDIETLYQFTKLDTATQLLGVFNDHASVYSIANVHESINTIKNRGIIVQNALTYDYAVSLPLASIFESAKSSLEGQRLMVNFIILIVVIIAGVMIYGLINISIDSKSYTFGVYRALGLKKYHILLQALLQALIKGLFGILGGVFLGLLISLIFFPGTDNIFPVSTQTLLYSMLVGFLLTLFASIYPVVSTAKKSILVSLDISKTDSTDFESRLSSKRTQWISTSKIYFGVGLSFVGILLFVILPFLRYNFGQQTVTTISMGLIIFVLIGIILIFLGLFAPILERLLLFVFFKINYKIALGSKIFLKKNRSRNAITMLVFALSLSFVLFMSTLQATSMQGSINSLQNNLGSDLTIFPLDLDKNLRQDLLNYTSTRSDVTASYTTSGKFFSLIGCNVRLGDSLFFKTYSPMIYATTPSLFGTLFTGVSYSPNSNLTAIDYNNTVIISKGLATSLDVGIGDDLRLEVSSGIKFNDDQYGKNIKLQVVGILERLPGFPSVNTDEQAAFQSPVFIGTNTWYNIIQPLNVTVYDQSITLEENIQTFYIKANSNSLSEVKNSIFLKFGTKILVVDYQESLEKLQQRLEKSVDALAIILSLSVIISLFAVLSSTSSAVHDSRHDIGVLKALGIKSNSIMSIFVLETIILTLVSTFLGGLSGYITGMMIAYQNAIQGNYPLPVVGFPNTIVFTYIFAMILAIIGAYLPSRAINKIEVIDILRTQ